jgi:hypothetical protein
MVSPRLTFSAFCSCDAETYRHINEIVEELKAIELASKATDAALQNILNKLGGGG